jgi:DNA repair protein RadC
LAPTDDPAQKAGHRDRLRQRFREAGPDGFHDYELLEYVLALAIPRRDTKPLAKALIAEFGDLATLLAASPAELARVDGLGETAIMALKFTQACAVRSLQRGAAARPVFTSMEAVADYVAGRNAAAAPGQVADATLDYLHARLAHELTEEFRVLFLNGRNMLIRDEAMGSGTTNQAPVYPREVVKRALELSANAIILVHNHPSGDPTPSRDDIQITRHIQDAARPLGITVHDHLVIGRTGHRSLRAEGLM